MENLKNAENGNSTVLTSGLSTVPSKPITVSKKFIDDFNLCMNYYGVSGEELEFEKSMVRKNFKDAQISYTKTADMLRTILQMRVAT